MKSDFLPRRLHVVAFAKAHGSIEGSESLSQFERLVQESVGAVGDGLVSYSAQGSIQDESGSEEVWLHLTAQATLPMTCQRCLGAVDFPLSFERDFRFVATEELAEAEDEESEEDVLVLSRDFNLLELIEDELLMAMPAVPKHEQCPAPVKLRVADPDFVDEPVEKIHPFAVLEQLKKKPLE